MQKVKRNGWYDKKETSKALEVCEKTIDGYRKEGELTAKKEFYLGRRWRWLFSGKITNFLMSK